MGRLVKLVTSVISLAETFRTPFEALGPHFSQLTVDMLSASVTLNSGWVYAKA